MKNLILSLFLTFFTIVSFSQTPVNIYVLNPNGCPYSVTNTWTSPFGAGNASITSVDSLMNQEVWHLEVPDSSNQAMLTVCVVPAPPCSCPMECVGPTPIYPNISLTILLCGSMNVDELEVVTIENPMVGTIVIPVTEPINYFLINSEGKIIKWGKNTTNPSFNSDDLQNGVYHLVLETQTNKKIYKLIK
jgi:hypothetical protein